MKPSSYLLPLGALLVSTLAAKAADGTWTNNGNGLWSTASNWSAGVVADDSGFTGNFNSIDITADRTVSLDSARILGHLNFGDTTSSSAGSWILNNNGVAANILTFAGATPTITVNSLGTNKSATISAVIAGNSGLIKSGAGSLSLSAANTYSGGTTIQTGTLGIGIASTTTGTTHTSGSTGVGNVTLAGGVAFSDSGNLWAVPTLTLLGDITLNGAARQRMACKTLDLSGGTRTISINSTGGNTKHSIPGDTALEGTGRSRWETQNTLGTMVVQNGTLALATNLTGTDYAGFMFQFPSIFADNAGVIVGPNVYLQTGLEGALGTTTDSTQTAKLTVNGIWTLGASVGSGHTVHSLAGNGKIYASMRVEDDNVTPRTITLNGTAGSTDFSGTLSNGRGTGKLFIVKTGASTQILSGVNTYTGDTTVTAGILRLSGPGTLGNGAGLNLSGGVLDLGGLSQAVGAVNLTAAAANGDTITPGILTWTSCSASLATGNAIVRASLLSNGTAGLTKTGAGTLTLYSPVLAKTVGTTSGSKTVTMADTGGVLVGDIMTGTGFAANAAVTAITPNTSVTISVNATASGSAVAATVIHPSTYTGPTSVNEGILVVNGSGYSSTTRSVNVSMLGATGVGNETIVDSGARVEFSSAFYHNCAESFVISGSGVSSAGVLFFNNSNWNLTGVLALAADAKIAGGQSAFSGTINLGSSILTIAKNSAVVDSWSAPISGPGGLTMAGGGSVTKLTLTGANTYTGPTTINSGILSMGILGNGGLASSPVGSSTSGPENLVLGGGTLQYTGATASSNRGFTLAARTTGTFEITNPATTLTLSGSSSATSGSLIKAGAGTLRLTGANSHTGATMVAAGTLTLGASGSIASSSAIHIAAAAMLDVSAANVTVGTAQTLSGSGTVYGSVTVNGTLAPGAGDALKFNGSLSLAPGSTTVVAIARDGSALTSNRIEVSGSLNFGGTLVISNTGGDVLQTGDSFVFFDSSSSTGSFSSVSAPPGYTFDSSQLAGGKIVVLTAPPPPGFQSFNVGGGMISLAWPTNYSGWFVQSNSVSLAPGGWMDLVGSNEVTSMSFSIDPALKHEFFRMRRPGTIDFPSDPLAKGGALDIATVWSGVPVGFAFVTVQDVQIAAYYNPARKLTLAARNINSTQWYIQTTAETFAGWDVHNYIAMSVDPSGQVHVAANMHGDVMNYFRTSQPVTDAAQFQAAGFVQQLSPLWNASFENRSTYPLWFTGPNGEFFFHYRNHTGTNIGSHHLMKYDTTARTFAQASGATPVFSWTGNYTSIPPSKSAEDMSTASTCGVPAVMWCRITASPTCAPAT